MSSNVEKIYNPKSNIGTVSINTNSTFTLNNTGQSPYVQGGMYYDNSVPTYMSYTPCPDYDTESKLGDINKNDNKHEEHFNDLVFKINKEEDEDMKNIPLQMPITIDDIDVVVENKVVKVCVNGVWIKTVCNEVDTFSLDTAVTVAIAKYAMGGSSKYNNIVDKAVRSYKRKLDRKAKVEADEKAKQESIARKREKNKKRLDAKKEKEFQMRKDAYKQAILELVDEKKIN